MNEEATLLAVATFGSWWCCAKGAGCDAIRRITAVSQDAAAWSDGNVRHIKKAAESAPEISGANETATLEKTVAEAVFTLWDYTQAAK
jgi:hypothetical protein